MCVCVCAFSHRHLCQAVRMQFRWPADRTGSLLPLYDVCLGIECWLPELVTYIFHHWAISPDQFPLSFIPSLPLLPSFFLSFPFVNIYLIFLGLWCIEMKTNKNKKTGCNSWFFPFTTSVSAIKLRSLLSSERWNIFVCSKAGDITQRWRTCIHKVST